MRRAGLICFVVAAACGDDGGASPTDAAVVDAVTEDDAAIDAAVPGPVTLTVRSRGLPVAGVDVVWLDAAGAVITHEATNAAGVATEDVLAGSAVMLAASGTNNAQTVTWLAIEPGDALEWTVEPAAPVRHGDVSVTLAGTVVTATQYRIQLGCVTLQTATPTVAVTGVLPTACLGSDQTIDVLATAISGNGTVLGYAVRTGVATVANGVTTVAMGAWQTTLDPLAVTLTNLPAMTRQITFEHHLRADGLDFRGIDTGGIPTAANVTLASGHFQGGIVERLEYALLLQRGPQATPEGISAIVAAHTGAPAAVSYDLATLLPKVTGSVASNASGRVQLVWTPAGSMAATDGAVMSAQWTQGAVSHTAFVIAPPGTASPLVLPPVPDALASYRPTASSVFGASATVIFADADFVASYRGFRAVAARWFTLAGVREALPASGGVIRLTSGG